MATGSIAAFNAGDVAGAVGQMSGKRMTKTTTSANAINLYFAEAGTHFILIGGTNVNRYAVLCVRVSSAYTVTFAEISKGSAITVEAIAPETGATRATLKITADAASMNLFIYDIALYGSYAT